MNKSLLVGALCASIAGFHCAPAPAQTLAAPGVATPNVAPDAALDAAKPNGAALFSEARALLKAGGPNGSPVEKDLAPDENLRRQRLAVARNAPALAKLREALAANLAGSASASGPDFSGNAAARELARQLAQEAAVRAADGQDVAAVQSSLDVLELGAQISSGAMISWLTGSAIDAVGRASLNDTAPKLDAEQTRAAITRLAIIQIEVPTLEAVLRGEEKIALNLGRPLLEDPKERAKMQTALQRPESAQDDFTHEQMRAVLALSPAQFETNVRAVFEEATMRAAQPYQTAIKADDLKGADPVTDLVKPSTGGLVRLVYERRVLNDRLALAALQLRLIKLESGAYPATFDAGADPFSADLAPLIYRRVGNSYVLYSVGPNGTDDNATPVAQDQGANLEAKGDLVAPVL